VPPPLINRIQRIISRISIQLLQHSALLLMNFVDDAKLVQDILGLRE
jgi:hypothetical protein